MLQLWICWFEIIPLESGWPEFGWFCTRQTHILPPPVLSHPESEPGVKALNLSQVVCLKPLFWINDPSRVAQIPPRVVSLAFHYARRLCNSSYIITSRGQRGLSSRVGIIIGVGERCRRWKRDVVVGLKRKVMVLAFFTKYHISL